MSSSHTPRSRGRSGHKWRKARERVKRQTSTCWICGDPIDKSLAWPDPMSFSVDHVEPLSLREDLALSPTNLRGAHLICNTKRGNAENSKKLQNSQNW